MTDTKLIEIFCILDDFCKYFALALKKHTLDSFGKRLLTAHASCPIVRE